jgi:hypothetical protein
MLVPNKKNPTRLLIEWGIIILVGILLWAYYRGLLHWGR